jgi:multidrug efflux pump subunit AcrA (membrane-fusion protein)
MTLGSAVVGTGEWKPTQRIILPWSALAANEGGPAVWVIDRAKRTVSLRAVAIDAFETGTIVISSGLQEGDLVVTDGGKFLSPGRAVTFDEASGT